MTPFRYDVESLLLSDEDCAAFAHLVHFLCHLQQQHTVSVFLASITQPLTETGQDLVQRRAREMWRTEVRA